MLILIFTALALFQIAHFCGFYSRTCNITSVQKFVVGKIILMFIYVYFDVSYANQDCIYLIKNKKK